MPPSTHTVNTQRRHSNLRPCDVCAGHQRSSTARADGQCRRCRPGHQEHASRAVVRSVTIFFRSVVAERACTCRYAGRACRPVHASHQRKKPSCCLHTSCTFTLTKRRQCVRVRMCAKDIVKKCAHSLWYGCFAYPPCVPPPPTHTSSFICRVSSCYHHLTVMPKCLLSLIPPLYYYCHILAILNIITTTTATTNLYRLPRLDLIEWVFVGRSFGKGRASHGCRDRRANVHEERVPSLPAPTTCAGRAPEAVCRPSRRQSRGHHYPGRAI